MDISALKWKTFCLCFVLWVIPSTGNNVFQQNVYNSQERQTVGSESKQLEDTSYKIYISDSRKGPMRISKALYLKPLQIDKESVLQRKDLEYFIGPTDKEETSDKDNSRIVNIKLLTTFRPYFNPSKSSLNATSNKSDEDNLIVFPDKSTEDNNDKMKFIKKIFKIYANDWLKNSSKLNTSELLPKRKLKYTVGYRSAKNCKLYEQYISAKTPLFATPLLPSVFPVLMQNSHCSRPLPLIVGGTNASRGEFPHMAGLGYDRGEWVDFLCGGSLISERYVLTAAHCANTRWGPPIMVRFGTRNLITDDGQNMDVEEVIVHPDYKEPTGYNDIALVKIVEGLRMGRTLRPACLPSPYTSAGRSGSYLTATGWGKTGFGLFSSPNLQKVSLKVMDSEICELMFLGGRRTLRLPEGIQSTMLCAAGYLDTSHDTCQGDSGGPLQTLTRHSKCMYEVIGITSFGKLCGTGLPAIYTRVSAYIDWIEDIVWPS